MAVVGIPKPAPILCYACSNTSTMHCVCKSAWYCSFGCRTSHWETHKQCCSKMGVVSKITTTIPDNTYDDFLSALRQNMVAPGLVLREDEVYDATKGWKIVPENRKRLFTKKMKGFPNRDEILRECKGIVVKSGEYEAFYNPIRHRLYVLRGDVIVDSAELGKLTSFMFHTVNNEVLWAYS